MRELKELLQDVNIIQSLGTDQVQISNITFDSRKVSSGSLFIALKGTAADGHEYIGQAIEKGAAAIICEAIPVNLPEHISCFQTDDSNKTLGIIARNFYGDPSARLELVGITGTNGKTSTVTLLHGLFISLGYKAGLISTIQNKINNTILPSTHTTPDPVNLNELLSKMITEGCKYCFMEVSSHAIDQQRISGLTFRGGIFSNITHDHLDYHKTFDAYLRAKKKFFDDLPASSFALVNKDDRNGMVVVQNTRASVHTYGLKTMADFKCRIIENQFQGLILNLDGTESWFKLIGSFNAYNILAVYSTAILLGKDKQEVLIAMSNIEPVEGRFNSKISPENVTAIVDYAHTPDALQNVLQTINAIRLPGQKLIAVVGAGGNRDASKRPVMARIACDLSDIVILTSDNPRFEDPELIIEEMKQGIDENEDRMVLSIVNRKEAIKTASALAKAGDIILVAGKGHETYQEIKGVKHHFNDKEILMELLKINKWE